MIYKNYELMMKNITILELLACISINHFINVVKFWGIKSNFFKVFTYNLMHQFGFINFFCWVI